MAFQVEDVAIEMVRVLRPLVQRVQGRDNSMADQMRRAATSVGLNIAEGKRLQAGNRRMRFITAAGSASEVRTALRLAVEWGYFAPLDAEPAHALLKRILNMPWKLTH